MKKSFILAALGIVYLATPTGADVPDLGQIYINSIGVKFVRIEPGTFIMGKDNKPLPEELIKNLSYPNKQQLKKRYPEDDPARFIVTDDHVRCGDFDEKPAHRVTITQPFYMAVCEITNKQYEMFDPDHRTKRGKNGFSKGDNEAVVFVNWYEATAFCKWLGDKEGLPYRLPTEAEWEYACRAGTTTNYWTGDTLPKIFHKNARRTSFDEKEDIVDLTVGQTPPNPWGLYDMHGNVEEWCYDWYGPYKSFAQVDPVGYADGNFKVCRGGSHGTNLYYLRSANRMGTLPEDKHWLIGFRPVIGPLPRTEPLAGPPPKRYQINVKQDRPEHPIPPVDMDKPFFRGPRRYVKIPEGSAGPLFSHHNHDPAIVECPNGDLLAIWYTCVEERGRELAIAASRLRLGQEQWEPASPFWDAPDRNDHCPALWFDGNDTIYHFNGLGVAGKWEPLAIIMRTSKDNGATWSKARLIVAEHGFRQMVGEPVFRTRTGAIVFGADASHGSTVWISTDNGLSFKDAGGHIRGIHAGITELSDGRLMALGRNENIDGWMPMSISADMGKTWEYSPSVFPPIKGGQRAALIRLKQGPLFFASFAKDIRNFEPAPENKRPPRHISNLFGALSFDDGKTWPVRRIITDCKPDHPVDTIDKAPVLMNPGSSEPLGYLSVCQDIFGIIHLISSTNHYAFNIAWLKDEAPAPVGPTARRLPQRRLLANVLDTEKRIGFLEKVDAHRGLTAEAAVRIIESEPARGFDFELFIRGGTLTVNHYLLTITTGAVHYWYDNKFVPIARGLDNTDTVHTYRLAVREDTAVQIYRDEKLLATMPMDVRIGWMEPARGSYIRWGTTENNINTVIHKIAYDPTGPYRPANSPK